MESPQFIEDLNKKIQAKGLSWQAKDTGITLENAKIMCGYNPGPDEPTIEERTVISKSRFAAKEHFVDLTLPSSVDHTTYMTPTKDQGKCGSCVAFGTIASVEGTTRFQRKDPSYPIDLSEAHLFYCHAASEGRTCGSGIIPSPWAGWLPERALIAFKQKGVVSQICFPYDPFTAPQACKLGNNWASSLTYISAYRKLSSIAEMKSELMNNGPLISSMQVYEDFMNYHGYGVYSHVTGNSVGGHCICIVGYNDTDNCWIAKNSWGPAWGNTGFFRIKYGECGIDYEMWVAYVN